YPLGVPEEAVLGADPGIIKAGRDAVGFENLAECILDQVRVRSMKDPWCTPAKRGTMPTGQSFTPGFRPVELYRVIEEGGEHPDGVGSPPDTGNHGIRESALLYHHLLPDLVPDNGLELPHKRG